MFQFQENPFVYLWRQISERLHLDRVRGFFQNLFDPSALSLKVDVNAARKVELVAAVVLLLGAGGMLYLRWDSIRGLFGYTAPDLTVVSWVENHQVGNDPAQPISEKNPLDTAHSTVITTFASHDGKLCIVEHPQNPTAQPEIKFAPDHRVRGEFHKYQDQMARLDKIKDEPRRAIELAAYLAVAHRPAGLLGAANLTADQRKDEKTARDQMLQQMTELDTQIYEGTFDSAQFQDLLDLLARYKMDTSDLLQNTAKQKLARQIMDGGLRYLGAVDDARAAVIEKYVDAVYDLLAADQRQKVAVNARGHFTARKHLRIG